jgi:hypothetical protein
MDHRPFEDWLLEDKVLIPDEKRALNAHLRDCTSCTALAEVDLALKSVRVAHAPVDALTAWLSSVLSFWASLQAVLNAGVVLFKVMPGFVPAYIWIVVLFAAGGWSLLWVFSLMKFTKFPRGV